MVLGSKDSIRDLGRNQVGSLIYFQRILLGVTNIINPADPSSDLNPTLILFEPASVVFKPDSKRLDPQPLILSIRLVLHERFNPASP